MSFEKFRSKRVIISICLVFLFMFMFAALLKASKEEDLKIMRAKIQEKGWRFAVGYTSVSKIPISKLCGLKEPKDWVEKGIFDRVSITKEISLPIHYDWREQGCVTPIRNQNPCGSCWAFGTIGSYESAICVKGGSLLDLSEQYLISCNTHGYGCDTGGWWVFDDMKNKNGVPYEACYPYECPDNDCRDEPCNSTCTNYYPVYNWSYVGSPGGIPSTDTIKAAILANGPVAAGVYVNTYFKNYIGGIFEACDNCPANSVNHAIILIGWDDADGGYWILKNSWGTGWGESGYMRIRYECCNVGKGAVYAIPMMN